MQQSVRARRRAKMMEEKVNEKEIGARAGKEIGAKAKEIWEREEKDGVAKDTKEQAKDVSRE